MTRAEVSEVRSLADHSDLSFIYFQQQRPFDGGLAVFQNRIITRDHNMNLPPS